MSTTTGTDQSNPVPQLVDLTLEQPSPCAPSLPVEILLKIFKLVLGGTDFSRRCRTKLACSQVSKAWREASEVGLEYLVYGHERASRLASMLKTTGRGGGVRHLEVCISTSVGKFEGNSVARILAQCRSITSLKLFVRTWRPYTTDAGFPAPFGYILAGSLGRCTQLKTLVVDSGHSSVPHAFFYS